MNNKVTAMHNNYVLFQTMTHANNDSKLNYLKIAYPGERIHLKGDVFLTSTTEGVVVAVRQGIISLFFVLLLGRGERVLRQGIENVRGKQLLLCLT